MDALYSPFDPAINDDPYPVYARLRAEAPIYHNPDLGFWALSRHADVSAALADSALLSSDHGPMLEADASGPQARLFLSFVAMDPPEHTRMRAAISKGFTPRRVAALEPMIRQIARGHIERAMERGTFDFARDIAARVPLDVISELVGVPPSERAGVHRDFTALIGYGLDPGTSADGVGSIVSLSGYYRSIVAERRAAPRDDLVSALIADEELTDDDIVAFLFLLIAAGAETTTHLLSAAWYWAWRHPDQRAAAFGGGITPWMEESLRYDTPAHGTARRLTRETEWYGVRVPENAKMWLLIGSANRDESVFPDAHVYDLGRDTARSISFGVGRHYCLGGPLARLEGRVTLEELTKAVMPDYDVDESRIRRVSHGNVRGVVSLPTTVKPA